MKTKSAKRSLAVSILCFVLCVAMLVGATYAWFTDSVTSGNNKIIAGNLDIDVQYSTDGESWASLEDATNVFNPEALWEPGHTEYVYLKVENKGTLALTYKMLVTPVSENGGINVNGDAFKLSDYLVFGTTEIKDELATYDDRAAARAAVGTTQGINVENYTKESTLAPNATAYLTMVVYMPEEVDNDANYLTGTTAPSIELGINVKATQLESESDSFGTDYDAAAKTVSQYVAGAYYDYFEAINETDESDNQGKFEVKKEVGSDIIASASGETETAGDKVTLVITKSDAAVTNFSGTVADGEELVGYDITVTGQKADSLVQSKLYVGTGLENFVLYHNGAAMTEGTKGSLTDGQYYYDSADGFVYFATTTFSPFQATYKAPVAAIGTAVYGTMQDAINAAPANAASATTITLLKNVDNGKSFGFEDSQANSGRNVVLNLNGFTYEFKEPGMGSTGTKTQAMHLSYGNTLVVKNGKLTVDEETTEIKRMIQNYCELTLEDVTVDCTNLAVKGGYDNSMCRGSLTVKGNTNFVASTSTAKIFDVDGAYCTTNGCSVKVVYDDSCTGKTTGTIEYVAGNDTYKSEFIVKSGTFDFDPSDYIANGKVVVPQSGKYVVLDTWAYGATIYASAENLTITTAQEFANFAATVNSGINYSGKTVKLGDNIDLSEKYWKPINGFAGTFDGCDYTISNLTVYGGTTGSGFGLFGNTNAKIIKNFTIHNVDVCGNSAVGAVLGDGNSTIEGVTVNGSILIGTTTNQGYLANYNSSYIGGIVGHGYSKVNNCTVIGDAGSVICGGRQVGGIFGFAGETMGDYINNCSVSNIELVGTRCVGGIVGWNHYKDNVKNCTVTNVNLTVTGTEKNTIGLITGTTYTNTGNCYDVFEGNTASGCTMTVNKETVKLDTPFDMYATYCSGAAYVKFDNNKYIFCETAEQAESVKGTSGTVVSME